MDRLSAMESFVRTVERGSFAAAASGGDLSPTMIGNHIRYLEQRLGALLLHRTTRRHNLTEFGRAYYERCRQILGDIEAAEASADEIQAGPRGLLRITAPVTLGTTILPRLLAQYLRLNPQVQIELVLQDQRVDLLADLIDIAIRAGVLRDSGLIARALPPMPLVVCASPTYLCEHGTPRIPEDLGTHHCLDFAHAADAALWRFTGPKGRIDVAVSGPLRSNNGQALRVAAVEGSGVVMQPEILVGEDLAAGRLVRLLPDYNPPSLPLHVLTLPDRRPTPKLRGFVKFIVERLRAPVLP